jgi:O-antigen/teichoic acid export membrane protein
MTVQAGLERPPVRALPSGARSGVVLAAASGASIVANYVFLLAAGRILGSESYGSLAALLGVLAVVLIPAGAIQMAVSREISRLLAAGASDEADAFARGAIRLAFRATGPLLAVALVLAVPLDHVLHINSVGIVILTELSLSTALVYPAALGVLQGAQRFHALASIYILPFVFRLALLAAAASAGYRLGGAILATAGAAIAGMLGAIALIRTPLRRGSHLSLPDLRPFLRYLAPVAVGLVGIGLLTHIDILVVKARFSGDHAGAYAAASAFARVAFFLPATILAVLFPRTAARQARGEETEDILGRSLLATAAFCAALALFYAAVGVGLVTATFGRDFAEGGRVLAPYAIAIGLFSLAQILVGYHLSRAEPKYAWVVAASVIVQLALLATVPTTLREVVWINVAIGVLLLVSHEVLIGSSRSALRAGLGHLGALTTRAKRVLPEAGFAFLGTTVFVCAFFGRVVVHLGSSVIGNQGGDSTGTVSWLWQLNRETGFHVLGSMHHTATGAPFGWDESNGLNVQWLLPYYPGYLLTKLFGSVVALNLVVLGGYILSGLAMYLLTRYVGCSRLVSAWAALVFIVFPWHLARAEHASLLHIEVLAFLILALIATARRTTWLSVAFVGAATFACWLTSGYYGAIAVVTTFAFALGAALFSKAPGRRLLVLGSTGAAFAATMLVGIASVASGINRGVGFGRVFGDLSIYGLRPLELVVPPDGNIVLGNSLASFHQGRDHGSNPTEITNYLGLLTIILAVAWLIIVVRRSSLIDNVQRRVTAGLVAAFVVGLAFAAPSPTLVFGHEIWMPSRLMWEITPAFRVPSRWDPLLMAALVPAAALGLQAVRNRSQGLARWGPALGTGLVVAAMAFSFLELAIKPPPHFRTTSAPAVYRAVEAAPPGILAEYPLGYSDIYRLWQRSHGRSILNGAPPSATPAENARLVLLDPAEPGTAEKLALLGVSVIAIHPDAHVDAEVQAHEPRGNPGFKLLARFPDGESAWEVVAQQGQAFVTLPGGFATPRRMSDGQIGFGLVSSAGVGDLQIAARNSGVVRLSFDVAPPAGGSRTLRLADASHEESFTLTSRLRISLNVEVPRGLSRLLVKVDPAATSEDDAVVLTAPQALQASGPPVLHAELVSSNPGF